MRGGELHVHFHHLHLAKGLPAADMLTVAYQKPNKLAWCGCCGLVSIKRGLVSTRKVWLRIESGLVCIERGLDSIERGLARMESGLISIERGVVLLLNTRMPVVVARS